MTAQKSARAVEAAGRTTKGSEVPMAEQTVTDLGAHGTITAEKFAVVIVIDGKATTVPHEFDEWAQADDFCNRIIGAFDSAGIAGSKWDVYEVAADGSTV